MKNFTLVLLFVIVCGKTFSQSAQSSVINSAGGEYANDSSSYEWSIGELVLVNEMVSSDGTYILTNGFLQPYSGQGKSIYQPWVFANHEIRLLNNPVKNNLGVQLITNAAGRLKLKVYDERGYLKYYKEIIVSSDIITETINMMSCANGTYFLKAEFVSTYQSKKYREGTYKFIKIQ